MKKIMFALAALAFAGTCVQAQTNQVLSRNAVGYVKLQVETGKLYLARMDFESLDGTPMAISNVIGDQLPTGSGVLLWDSVGQQYIPLSKSRSGWGAGGSNTLERGESFFLRGPETAASNSYTVFLMGEVPDRFTAPTSTTTFVEGLGMAGFPYPVQVQWTNTTLAQSASTGDGLLIWDSATQQYIPFSKSRSGWGASGDALVIEPGQGFWFRKSTAGTLDWEEVKPYTWP